MKESFLRKGSNLKVQVKQHCLGIIGSAINVVLLAVFISGCTKEVASDQQASQSSLAAVIAETYPANQADTVIINPVIAVTFASTASTTEISASTLILKEGTIPVAGTVTTSGVTINFTPKSDLKPETEYTATIKSSKEGSSVSEEHSWKFKTGKHRNNGGALSVVSVIPAKGATEIAGDGKPTITFNQEITSAMSKLVTFTLLQGTTPIPGTLSFSGKTATFTPDNQLTANLVYAGKVNFQTGNNSSEDNEENDDDNHQQSASNFTWSFTTGTGSADVTPPTVVSVVPINNTTGIALNSKVAATFSEAMNSSTITSATFTLKDGTTAIAGTVTYSGSTATFTPSASLMANKVYTATITVGAKDVVGNALASNYTWSFTTTTTTADVTPPTVLSVIPVNSSTGIAINSKATATFSEPMNSSTITSATFTVKQGLSSISGTVTYSGTTATFTPSSNLAANMVYTATITTGAKDAAGNALANNYTWNFTTVAPVADTTPPTVISIIPANNSTGIVITGKVTATFSEAMNSSTITSSTFTLKDGTTNVAGTVTYSGSTATFTPSASLANNKVYTATITTGAKDAAGNAISGNYSWSFTTVAAANVVSFASQVLPILQNKCMPCHGATSPTAGISITNYSTVSKLSNTQLDNSRMYPKMGVTAAEQALIKSWIAAGRPNN